MRRVRKLAIVGIGAAAAAALASGPVSANSNPNCSTISAATVQAGIGGNATAPKIYTYSGGVHCQYGSSLSSDSIEYDFNITTAKFNQFEATDKGTSVSSLGYPAFTNSDAAGNFVQVLKGSTQIIIGGQKATNAALIAFAKKILPAV